MADNPIDFTGFALKRLQEREDRERVKCVHPDGETWFAYLYEFDFLDKKFALELWARSKDEALAACEAARQSLRYVGPIYDEIPTGDNDAQ